MALGAGCTVSGVHGVMRGHAVRDAQCIERGARCSVQGARGGARRTAHGAQCGVFSIWHSGSSVNEVVVQGAQYMVLGAGRSVHGIQHRMLSAGCLVQDAQ